MQRHNPSKNIILRLKCGYGAVGDILMKHQMYEQLVRMACCTTDQNKTKIQSGEKKRKRKKCGSCMLIVRVTIKPTNQTRHI